MLENQVVGVDEALRQLQAGGDMSHEAVNKRRAVMMAALARRRAGVPEVPSDAIQTHGGNRLAWWINQVLFEVFKALAWLSIGFVFGRIAMSVRTPIDTIATSWTLAVIMTIQSLVLIGILVIKIIEYRNAQAPLVVKAVAFLRWPLWLYQFPTKQP